MAKKKYKVKRIPRKRVLDIQGATRKPIWPTVQAAVEEAANIWGLPYDELLKQLLTENEYLNPKKSSDGKHFGLTQFGAEAMEDYGMDRKTVESTEPENIRKSVIAMGHYVHDLKNRYNGSMEHALAAYNWGLGNIDKYKGKVLPREELPDETRAYLETIYGNQVPLSARGERGAGILAPLPTEADLPRERGPMVQTTPFRDPWGLRGRAPIPAPAPVVQTEDPRRIEARRVTDSLERARLAPKAVKAPATPAAPSQPTAIDPSAMRMEAARQLRGIQAGRYTDQGNLPPLLSEGLYPHYDAATRAQFAKINAEEQAKIEAALPPKERAAVRKQKRVTDPNTSDREAQDMAARMLQPPSEPTFWDRYLEALGGGRPLDAPQWLDNVMGGPDATGQPTPLPADFVRQHPGLNWDLNDLIMGSGQGQALVQQAPQQAQQTPWGPSWGRTLNPPRGGRGVPGGRGMSPYANTPETAVELPEVEYEQSRRRGAAPASPAPVPANPRQKPVVITSTPRLSNETLPQEIPTPNLRTVGSVMPVGKNFKQGLLSGATNATGTSPIGAAASTGDTKATGKKEDPKATPYRSLADSNKVRLRDLLGEIYALGDTPDFVQGQHFEPQLMQPYQISLQDRLNQANSTFRAASSRITNPESLAALAAQKYEADNTVMGEQFRINQEIASKTYNQNVETMNQAALQNLQLADQQYTRQAQAVANTKAKKQAALSSIGDKYSQKQSENVAVRLQENLFDFRPDKNMQMQHDPNNPWQLIAYNIMNGKSPYASVKTTKKTDDGTETTTIPSQAEITEMIRKGFEAQKKTFQRWGGAIKRMK